MSVKIGRFDWREFADMLRARDCRWRRRQLETRYKADTTGLTDEECYYIYARFVHEVDNYRGMSLSEFAEIRADYEEFESRYLVAPVVHQAVAELLQGEGR